MNPIADIVKENYMRSCEGNAIMDQSTIDSWIKEGLDYLNDNPNETIYWCRSGDSLVFMTKFDDVVEIHDTKVKRSATIPWSEK